MKPPCATDYRRAIVLAAMLMPFAGCRPDSDQTVVQPTSSRVPRFELGVNVSPANYYSGEPSFANLLTGDRWRRVNWSEFPQDLIDERGNVRLSPGERSYRGLTPPASVLSGKGAMIRCTWSGSGNVQASIRRVGEKQDHAWEFFWPGVPSGKSDNVWLDITASSTSDPLRDFDCREKGVASGEVFSPEIVESLKPFSVLRFLDWSAANANPANVTWARRTRADSLDQAAAPYGVALEHMVALANRVDADPWFNIPWNADEDYVRRMAQLVHDGVPGHRHVYAELSNEVWNYAFGVTNQAQAEGVAAGLAPNDRYEAALLRYAEKTRWAMRIWAQVFADRPGQLVRVAATQASNAWSADIVLGKGQAAADVDALAIAPYFGYDLLSASAQKGVTDTGILLSTLAGQAGTAMSDSSDKNAAVARKYGKRLIAYEAGQHMVDTDVELLAALNRSETMYSIYKNYITSWKTRFNDTMVLFNSTSPISKWGAWGLREYAGQPLAQTPKRRAAIEMGRR